MARAWASWRHCIAEPSDRQAQIYTNTQTDKQTNVKASKQIDKQANVTDSSDRQI